MNRPRPATDRPAVVQPGRFRELFADDRTKFGARQRLVPDDEVGRRAEQGAAAAASVAEQHVLLPAGAVLLIGKGAVPDDVLHIVDVAGRLHPERLEQAGAREFGERQPARAGDDFRQQHIVAVGIGPLLPWGGIEPALAQDHGPGIDISVRQVQTRPSRGFHSCG